jgi:hypothetical protein
MPSDIPVYRQRYKSKDWVHRKTIVKQANSLLILEVKDEECLVGLTGTARFLHQILDKDKPLCMSLKELFQLFEIEPSELKAKDRVLQERLLKGFELLPKADTADTEQEAFFRQACLYIKEHIYNHSSESSKPYD